MRTRGLAIFFKWSTKFVHNWLPKLVGRSYLILKMLNMMNETSRQCQILITSWGSWNQPIPKSISTLTHRGRHKCDKSCNRFMTKQSSRIWRICSGPYGSKWKCIWGYTESMTLDMWLKFGIDWMFRSWFLASFLSNKLLPPTSEADYGQTVWAIKKSHRYTDHV